MSARTNLLVVKRIIVAALVAASLACAIVLGVFAYYVVAATRVQDVPMSPEVAGAFANGGHEWTRHMDLPVRRLALISAEEYGSGNYLFVFDVYSWFGIGSGYVTHGSETRACGGGGLMRDGGFAGFAEHVSDVVLEDTRAQCIRAYGPGRLVAPARILRYGSHG